MPRPIDPIDRNAVLQLIEDTYCKDCNNYNGVRCRACNFDDAMSTLDAVPTLDYAPVRHSQWILHNMNPRRVTVDGYVVCPECEHTFDRIKGTWFKRCPNCGAKMDAKEDAHG